MKNTTVQNRLAKIEINNHVVNKIIKSVALGELSEGVSFSIFKNRPSIQFFSCNPQYHLYDSILTALDDLGLKTKSEKNKKGFDIKILNIEYEN